MIGLYRARLLILMNLYARYAQYDYSYIDLKKRCCIEQKPFRDTFKCALRRHAAAIKVLGTLLGRLANTSRLDDAV